jgi:hypothetical protein
VEEAVSTAVEGANSMASAYVVEHLNHLGIVAEVCREIGVAEWLDQQEPGNRQQVSVGTATVALVLNGLGCSNRQRSLVPQCFADKPVAHLLGPGLVAEDRNDDCLGRTLDWLYEQDVTRRFAGLTLRARRAFGVEVARLHADTTAFSVHGQYALSAAPVGAGGGSGSNSRAGRWARPARSDRGDRRLLARPPRGPQAVDASVGDVWGGRATVPATAGWQRQ